jgi:polysaccharide biosynthesis protein PslH
VRILYLCHRIPYPPNKGDKIRAFHHIRVLAARHDVDVFTLADDERDLAYRDALAAHCRRLTVVRVHPRLARLRSLPYLLTGTPLSVPYFYSAELQAEVRNALSQRSYDRIFVYCSTMFQYVPPAESISVVTDLVDMDSDKWRQYAAHTAFPFSAVYRREGRALQLYERKVCERSACAVVSTEREAWLARRIAPAARVHVVPNGVDTEYFRPHGKPPQGPPHVIFTGDMSYFPNEEAVIFFARRVLPLIRNEIAGVRFLIVGRNPGRKVHELQALDGVEVTGFVPDVREWLAKAQVAVAPFTIAAGIQNKILEAMAYGLPVVATTRAAQGLSAHVTGLVATGETAEELAAQVVAVLRDSQLAQRKGTDGRRKVTEEYSWATALDRLLQLVENPLAETQRSTPQPSHVNSLGLDLGTGIARDGPQPHAPQDYTDAAHERL